MPPHRPPAWTCNRFWASPTTALSGSPTRTWETPARDFLLRAKPADVEVRLRLAALEHDTGRARALYESVLRENPTHPVALVNLGSLYARAGRVEEAGNLWRRALDTNPGIEEAALNLAQVGTPSEARAILTRYLEFNPGSNTARARLHSISSK
jgi:tetratricopeptide (TPR) repeat protein